MATSDELLSGLLNQGSRGVSSQRDRSIRSPFYETAAQETEQKIQKRGSSIGFLRQVVQEPTLAKQHPFMTALSGIGVPFEVAESIPANIALGIQQRKPASQIFQDVVAGVKGERPAQLGDIAQASGLPVISNPFVASSLGLATLLSPGLLTKTGRAVATRTSEEIAGQASGIGSMATVSSRAKLAGRVASIPEKAREGASQKFGAAIDEAVLKQRADPSLLFDLQDVGQVLRPVKSHLKSGEKHAGSDLVSLLVDDPSVGVGVNLLDARAIKAGIQRSPEINRPTEAGRILRQARDLIRAQEVDKLGLGGTFSEFRNVMNAYRDIYPKTARLGHTAPVSTGLRQLTESEVTRKGLEKVAQQSGQRRGFAEVLGAARTAGAGRALGRAAPWLVGGSIGAAGALLGSKFLGRRQSGSYRQ